MINPNSPVSIGLAILVGGLIITQSVMIAKLDSRQIYMTLQLSDLKAEIKEVRDEQKKLREEGVRLQKP